jgi:hypothetical protein
MSFYNAATAAQTIGLAQPPPELTSSTSIEEVIRRG